MATTITSTQRLTGTVVNVVDKRGPTHPHRNSFFFINSGGLDYFASINDVKNYELPKLLAMVRFDPLPVFTPGKNPRAINIEIVESG